MCFGFGFGFSTYNTYSLILLVKSKLNIITRQNWHFYHATKNGRLKKVFKSWKTFCIYLKLQMKAKFVFYPNFGMIFIQSFFFILVLKISRLYTNIYSIKDNIGNTLGIRNKSRSKIMSVDMFWNQIFVWMFTMW